MKKIFFLIIVSLFLNSYTAAQDIAVDMYGNIETGTTNSAGNLNVQGESGEHGIVGETSGTGAAGVYGKNNENSNYGALGTDSYGVYGNSVSGEAGYFEGDARITGNLTVDGSISGETDPTVNASVKDGVDWTEITGIPDGFADGIDDTGSSDIWTPSGSDIYYNSGNVGIGTASPAGRLDVAGALCLSGDCKTSWPAGSGTGAFTDTGNSAYYTGGDVGIGTTTPDAVGGTDSTVLHLKQAVDLLEYSTAGIRLEVDGMVNGGISSAYNSISGEGGVFIGALTNHRLGFVANSMEKMSLTPSGNLGIGTISPLQLLHVQGNAYINDNLGIGVGSPTYKLQVNGSDSLLSSTAGDFRLYMSKNTDTDYASLVFQKNYVGHAEVGLTGNNDLHFKVSADGTTFADAMIINHVTGNVAIGIVDTSEGKLEVATSDIVTIYAENEGDGYDTAFLYKGGIGNGLQIFKQNDTGNSLLVNHRGTDPAILVRNKYSENMVVEATGHIGVGTTDPTSLVDINGATGYGQLRIRTTYTPTSTSDTNGNVGDVTWDDNYMYIKTSAGWKRSALSTF